MIEIIPAKQPNGEVTFTLSKDGDAIWVTGVIPAHGGEFDGGWVAFEHFPSPAYLGKRKGFFFREYDDAVCLARQMVEVYWNGLLS